MVTSYVHVLINQMFAGLLDCNHMYNNKLLLTFLSSCLKMGVHLPVFHPLGGEHIVF